MKRILFTVFIAYLTMLAGCTHLQSGVLRSPSSTKPAVTPASNTQTPAPIHNYLKHYLIRNGGFNNMDRQDCKGFAQQSAALCKTDDCKAILYEQEFRCKDQNCKAFISERAELCTDEVCRALINNQPEKCKSDDKVCQSMLNQDSAVCANEDCRAWLDQTPIKCKSDQCRAIVAENINFCDSQPK